MSDTRTIVDEFGKLKQVVNSRGKWIDVERTVDGHTFALRNPKTKDYITAIQADALNIRLNDLDDRVEVNGKPISDPVEAVILNRLRDYGLSNDTRMRDAILQAAFFARYNPLAEYVGGLRWDGADHIGGLCQYIKFDSVTGPLAPVFIRKFLIGAIAKMLGHYQNFMLVLDGDQGLGKSFVARWLCPLTRYFVEGPVRPEDKDHLLRLMSNWLWEVSELEGTTRRADVAALKDFITMREVTTRRPYARNDITKPAICSFIGTINEDGGGFLRDTTGNRRFAIVKIDDMRHEYSRNIDPAQLWAQAAAAYSEGTGWQFNQMESAAQNRINAEYSTVSAIEEMVLQRFELTPNATGDFMATVDVLKRLKDDGLNGADRANLMELSAILKKYNLSKARIKGSRGFYGIVPTYAEVGIRSAK